LPAKGAASRAELLSSAHARPTAGGAQPGGGRAGRELHLVNGCTTARYTDIGTHIGVTEYYVGENARVTSSMIHHWGAEVEVYPRTAAHVERGGHFVSNYIAMSRVGRIQMYPTAIVESGATASFNSVVYAPAGSSLDLGARVILRGTHATADIISRAVSDGGYVMNRGHILGEAAGSRGHMECNGLLLDPRGVIHAIPELEGRSPDIALSHEASVGMISREELAYLMASGLAGQRTADHSGFLEIPLADLPPFLQNTVRVDRAGTEQRSRIGIPDNSVCAPLSGASPKYPNDVVIAKLD
jgi:Fe-S cluster assembly scaffold protein SufB